MNKQTVRTYAWNVKDDKGAIQREGSMTTTSKNMSETVKILEIENNIDFTDYHSFEVVEQTSEN